METYCIKKFLFPLCIIIGVSGCGKVKSKIKDIISIVKSENVIIDSGTGAEDKEVEKKKFTGLRKTKHPNGNIRSECNYLNGRREGLCKTFYEDGTIHMEVEYKDGEKEGFAKWYYSNGKLYQEINYKDGWKDGYHREYYDNGNLKSEILFKEDKPAIGLKEYTKSGKLKTDYPELIITDKNTTAFNDEYVVYISLNNYKGKDAEVYIGDLTDGKFLDPVNLSWLRKDTKANKWFYILTVYPGQFIMKKLNVVAKVKTGYGNPLVLQKTFNVSVSND
jgi:antitoxin component YwqK of YwqJK toxin-antitoxin module